MNFPLKRTFLFLAILATVLMLVVGAGGPVAAAPADDLVITGIIDGPLSGGVPKSVELYAIMLSQTSAPMV